MKLALFAAALIVVAPLPARALPGQTIAQFVAWSKTKAAFRENLERSTEEMSGWPQFHVRSADHGVAWDFTALTDGHGAIRAERFGMSSGAGEIGSEPIDHRGTGYGFTFFSATFGPALASEYRRAKLVATTGSAHALRYYQGTHYGFIDDGRYLQILTLPWFHTTLAQDRRCAQHPERCSE